MKYVKAVFRVVLHGSVVEWFALFALAGLIFIVSVWSLSAFLDTKESEFAGVPFLLYMVLLARVYNTAAHRNNKKFSVRSNLFWGLAYLLVAAVSNLMLFKLFRPEYQTIGLFQGEGILSFTVVSALCWVIFVPVMVWMNNGLLEEKKKRRLNGQLTLFKEADK